MEMKKYMSPEMEIIELKNKAALLAGSGEDELAPGGVDEA